jgi:L-amino acid N-acyltransferase YncA
MLVAGSGFEFDDRGERDRKGVPGPWRRACPTSGPVGTADPFALVRSPHVLTIRPAVAADTGAIAKLVNAFLSSTTIEWRYEPYSDDAMSDWARAHECVLVAADQEEVVGVAAFGPFRDAKKWPGYRFTVENTVHVREDRWRTGVGEELMRALIEAARQLDKHSMIAAVDGENLSSIRFHERLGFREVARMPEVGAKFGRWLDLVLLELRLDDRRVPGED